MRGLNKIKKSKISVALALLGMLSPVMKAAPNSESLDSVISLNNEKFLGNDNDDFPDENLKLLNADGGIVSEGEIHSVYDELMKYAKKRQNAVTPVLKKFYAMQEEFIASKNQPSKKEILIKNLKVLARKHLPKLIITPIVSYLGWKLANRVYKRVRYGTPIWRSYEEKILHKYLDKMMLNDIKEIGNKSSINMKPVRVNGTDVEFKDEYENDEVVQGVYVPAKLSMKDQVIFAGHYVNPAKDDNIVDLNGVKNAVLFVGKGRNISVQNISSLKRLLIFCDDETKISFDESQSSLEYFEIISPSTADIVNLKKSKTYAIKCSDLHISSGDGGTEWNLSALNSWFSSSNRVAMKILKGIIDKDAKINGYIGKGKTMYIYNP